MFKIHKRSTQKKIQRLTVKRNGILAKHADLAASWANVEKISVGGIERMSDLAQKAAELKTRITYLGG